MKRTACTKLVVEVIIFMITMSSCTSLSSEKSPTPTNAVVTTAAAVTPSPNPTNTSVGNIHLTRSCVEIALTMDFLKGGTIVYRYNGDQTGLLNMDNGREIHLGKTFPIMAVSPDFMHLAYTTESPSQLHIVNKDGDPLTTVPIPEDWQGVMQWIDEENILIERFIYAPYQAASAILYNLKTGEHREFLPGFPSFETFTVPPLWENFSYSRMIFDPNFSRVIYPKMDAEGYRDFTLINVADQIPILQLQGFPDSGAPQWTKDGAFVIAGLHPDAVYQTQATREPDNHLIDIPYVSGFDLFQVGRDGDIRQLTYFTTQYNAAEEMISLSPNEKYVAFWLNLDYQLRNSRSRRELAILDIGTGDVTNLCLSDTGTPFQPIWSSDGKYLIVNLAGGNNIKTNVVLIDLERNIGHTILWGGSIAKAWLSFNNP